MTRVVIEDTRYVEPDELGEMVQSALDRTPSDLLDVDLRTFRIEQLETSHGQNHVGAKGEARVEASLCQREGQDCRIEFETIGLPDDGDGLTPMEVSFRVVEEQLAG